MSIRPLATFVLALTACASTPPAPHAPAHDDPPAVASPPRDAGGPSREELRALDEKACKARGWDWVAIPGLCANSESGQGCGFTCDVPTKDAGAACHGKADCEGECLCGGGAKDGDGELGACSRHVHATELSDCMCLVEGGKSSYPHGCS
jgi:hypothetical protein